ncbi:ribosome small subunit-dependent GTPase A [Shouchella lonarensis]|uniref:Small ribosomal subunit biogenesis GTPase RsgA n=1 Tax=Shouchella lonarensis TaxID=1464122 RepID=A0A1G6L9L7_9BACI|nr:ribosome small subunit-dependent GTPase A [Shouchella lonarensis]SDC39813.1 ribosome biogenesis GTPase [Shouchella lonarensis]
MASGVIVKALAGFYYVQDGERYVQCRARGLFREKKQTPLVGDQVIYEAENETEGYIMALKARKNELSRPPVANIDQAILVFSAREPDLQLFLLDKLLIHIAIQEIDTLIVVTKIDLLEPSARKHIAEQMEVYREIGYQVLFTSAKDRVAVNDLCPYLANRISVLAGQSGVGKSSLLNVLSPSLQLETNKISTHLGRGRHTTRHVELLPLFSGWIADTPGFSSLDFTAVAVEDVRFYFPEFVSRMDGCKYHGCLHDKEPACAVKQAVANDEIAETRYKHYLQFLEEIRKQKRRYSR